MLEEGAGLWFFPINFGSGRPKLIPHLVKGDGDYLVNRKDFNSSPNIADASVDAMMDFFSGPGLTVLQVLEDINLPSSFSGILEPAIPEAIVSKPVLSGASFKCFIPAFGPGEFILESGQQNGNLFTEVRSRSDFGDYSIPLHENSKDTLGLRISPDGNDKIDEVRNRDLYSRDGRGVSFFNKGGLEFGGHNTNYS